VVMIKPPTAPTVAISRVLRDLGLEQGKGRDFRIAGEYRGGERRSTYVVVLSRRAEEVIAEEADRIEERAAWSSFPFTVSVHYTETGHPITHITNGAAQRVRETPPAIARPTMAEVERIAAAEAPAVVAMLRTRRDERAYVTYVRDREQPVAGAEIEAEQVSTQTVGEALAAEVRTELAEAETLRLRPDVTGVDPYTSPAYLAGRIRMIGDHGYGHIEFSDRSQRGPERRELAVALAQFFDLIPVRRPRWNTVTVEDGYETDTQGRMRMTSHTEERVENRLGYGRTDVELTGDPEQLARFAALLPRALAKLDKLSADWGRRYARQLATRDEAEYVMMPSEHRSAVRRWRRTFARHIAGATGAQRSLGAGVLAEGEFLHRRESEAAAEAMCEIGWLWLEDLETAGGRELGLTAATYSHTVDDVEIAAQLAKWAQRRTAELEQQLAQTRQTAAAEELVEAAAAELVAGAEDLLDQAARAAREQLLPARHGARPGPRYADRPASRRPRKASAPRGSVRPPVLAVGRSRRTPVRGSGGGLRTAATTRTANPEVL